MVFWFGHVRLYHIHSLMMCTPNESTISQHIWTKVTNILRNIEQGINAEVEQYNVIFNCIDIFIALLTPTAYMI